MRVDPAGELGWVPGVGTSSPPPLLEAALPFLQTCHRAELCLAIEKLLLATEQLERCFWNELMNEHELESQFVIGLQNRDLHSLAIPDKTSGFISQTFILLNKGQPSACYTLLNTEGQRSSITNLNLQFLPSHKPCPPPRSRHSCE
jgi:hypothetical protein